MTPQHCWTDYRETLPLGSPEWAAWYSEEAPTATCMLPAGHNGAHEWTPDADIAIQFEAQAAS